MLRLFKDISIAYFTVTLLGAFASILIFDAIGLRIVCIIFVLLWIYACALTFEKWAMKRIAKILEPSNNCNIKKSLDGLLKIYKGRANKLPDILIATYIASLLLNLGKTDLALKVLLSYDAQSLLSRKRLVTNRCIYYNLLASCYIRLNRQDEALKYLKLSEECFKDPYFNQNFVADYVRANKINHLCIEDRVKNADEIIALLKEGIQDDTFPLTKVSRYFSIVYTLNKCDRLNEAEEYIEYIKQNGGDTVYQRCAEQNDFSWHFLDKINKEPFDKNI